MQGLCDWISGELGFRATHLSYHVGRGGAYLKEAVAPAGLGSIGLNNLLVTREFGPRVRLRALTLGVPVRLRALTLDAVLPSTGPTAFDPVRELAQAAHVLRPAVHEEYTPGEEPSDYRFGLIGVRPICSTL